MVSVKLPLTVKYKACCVDLKNNLINKSMKELIKKMNLHTINVEGNFIISEEQLEAFAKMYHAEQLALYDVVGRSEQLCDHPEAVVRDTVHYRHCMKCGKKF